MMTSAEKACVRSKTWYADNRDRALATRRKYHAANRVACNARSLAWKRENPARALLAKAKSRAKKRGILFTLALDDLYVPTHCPVLGILLCADGPIDSRPSLDRITGAEGYIAGNVIVVSWRANRLKNDASPEELNRLALFYGSASR